MANKLEPTGLLLPTFKKMFINFINNINNINDINDIKPKLNPEEVWTSYEGQIRNMYGSGKKRKKHRKKHYKKRTKKKALRRRKHKKTKRRR